MLRAVLHAVLHAKLLERELVGGTSATAVVQEMVVAEALVGVVQVQGRWCVMSRAAASAGPLLRRTVVVVASPSALVLAATLVALHRSFR